jgi:hypothetical protein
VVRSTDVADWRTVETAGEVNVFQDGLWVRCFRFLDFEGLADYAVEFPAHNVQTLGLVAEYQLGAESRHIVVALGGYR